MYKKKQRAITFLTCTAFVLVTVFSVLFVVKEADHDCTGESCPICEAVQQAEQNLEQLGTGTSEIADVVPAMVLLVSVLFCVLTAVSYATLISQKVRLNN